MLYKKEFLLFILFFLFVFLPSSVEAQKKLRTVEPKKTEKTSPVILSSSIVILSELEGIDVYVNDRFQGRTTGDGKIILNNKPKMLSLKPGQYKVRFEHPDYKSDLQSVNIVNGQAKNIKPTLVPKFGFLVLANASENSKLELDGVLLKSKDLLTQKDGTIKIKVALGDHDLKVSQNGYNSFIRQQIQVKDANPITIAIEWNKLQAKLIVKTNPSSRVYIDKQLKGIIPTTGELLLEGLSPDETHQLVVELDGYERFEKSLTLTTDKETLVDQKLNLLPTSSEFVDSFGNGLIFWDAPTQWNAEGGFLRVANSKEVGLIKEKNYCNAEVIFGLRLVKSRGAAWVLRAQDKENYYLFYLSGKDGHSPNNLSTYICRNGFVDLSKPAIISLDIPFQIEPDQNYGVKILVKGNTIEHVLTSNKTGQSVQIGFFQDYKNIFPCGNVGFVALSDEDFKVYAFVVNPIKDDSKQNTQNINAK